MPLTGTQRRRKYREKKRLGKKTCVLHITMNLPLTPQAHWERLYLELDLLRLRTQFKKADLLDNIINTLTPSKEKVDVHHIRDLKLSL